MSSLILKRGSASRRPGQWRDDDNDVPENGVVVARIFILDAAGRWIDRGCGRAAATATYAELPTDTSRRARPQWRHSLRQMEEHLEDTENNFE
jgi:hypothetical protein